jgi:hypothetical protein
MRDEPRQTASVTPLEEAPQELAGGRRLLLISTDALDRRVAQHRAAIAAAVQAGVEIDGAELVQLAARTVRWRPALDRFTPSGNPAGYRIRTAAIEVLLAGVPSELHDAVLGTWTTSEHHGGA